MYERRRQAASLVSLLVVTSLFVWACSSSDHEGGSVTTSGGAGSALSLAGARSSEAEGAPEPGAGGTGDLDGSSPVADAGSEPSMSPNEGPPTDGGKEEAGAGGASPHGDPPEGMGGTIAGAAGQSNGGGPSSSGASSAGASPAGASSLGGAPAAEPVCDPADDHSTPDMFLPCDVSTALYACRNCHSSPPVKGVFTSYVSYADIKANAAQIYGVIKSGVMPRPPYTLSAWQKSTALKWLGKNGSCAIGALKSCQ